jgi:hypothetical protein
MIFRRRKRDPVPPENLRIVHADGSETPVLLVYLCCDENGRDVWESVQQVEWTDKIKWDGEIVGSVVFSAPPLGM